MALIKLTSTGINRPIVDWCSWWWDIKSYSFIYREKILNKDESFFLENEYSEIKAANEDDENTVEQVINKLKKYWGELSIENKEKIWKYLETLIKLSDLIA